MAALAWIEHRHGWKSVEYLHWYLAMRPLQLIAILNLGRPRVGGFLFAVLVAYISLLGYQFNHEDIPLLEWVLLVEGFCYIGAGASLSLREEKNAVTLVLSSLWLLWGIFSLSYLLENWVKVDDWWQSVCAIVAFLIVGLLPNEVLSMRERDSKGGGANGKDRRGGRTLPILQVVHGNDAPKDERLPGPIQKETAEKAT